MKLLLVIFLLVSSINLFSQNDSIISDTTVYSFIDVNVKPKYPSGDAALMEYLAKNLEYPSDSGMLKLFILSI